MTGRATEVRRTGRSAPRGRAEMRNCGRNPHSFSFPTKEVVSGEHRAVSDLRNRGRNPCSLSLPLRKEEKRSERNRGKTGGGSSAVPHSPPSRWWNRRPRGP